VNALRCQAALPATFHEQARAALEQTIVPFWWRTIDPVRGGVYNCFNNDGSRLIRRDKFTWSQGRFAWWCARLAEAVRRGLIAGDADLFLAQAEKTVRFLQAHVFLEDGRCAFLLSEEGRVKEAIPGAGPAPSIYADCFVVMGFAEYARMSGDRAVLDAAWRLFEHIEARIAAAGIPTIPEPIPPAYDSHAIAMIHLNLTLVLRDACERLNDARLAAAHERNVAAGSRIFDQFLLPGGRIAELRLRARGGERELLEGGHDSLLSRHLNPGHALEGLWMLLTVAAREGRSDWLVRANEAVRFTLQRGWDEQHGGILHYVDHAGGPPRGAAGDSVYEAGVRGTWDTKLWWVHSEAIYTTALSYTLSGSDEMRAWFERVWDYAFRVFPHPDPAVGEWIQIRDRRGEPLDRVVALPVKDPYHITRNLLQVIELGENAVGIPASESPTVRNSS
jgi:N-acylglucosamine 2-epimerase